MGVWQLADIETMPFCHRNVGRFLESDPFRIARGDISHYKSVQPICWMTDCPPFECMFMNLEKSHGYCTICQKWIDVGNDIEAVTNHVYSDEHASRVADGASEVMVDTPGIVHYLGIDAPEAVMDTILVISRNNSPSLLKGVIGSAAKIRRVRFDELELFAPSESFDCVVVHGGEEMVGSEGTLLALFLTKGLQFAPQCVVFEGSCSTASAVDAFLRVSTRSYPVVAVIEGAGALCLCEIGARVPRVAEPLALHYGRRWKVFVANRLERQDATVENSWLMSFELLGQSQRQMMASLNFSSGTPSLKRLTSLRLVVLKDTRVIPACSFEGSSLASIDLSDVEEIGAQAFRNCLRLEAIVFGLKLAQVGAWAFCTVGLSSLELSHSTGSKSRSGCFFGFCRSDRLKLGYCCFSSCRSLRTINLPSSVEFGFGAFRLSPLIDCVFLDGERLSVKDLTPVVFEHARISRFGISCLPVAKVVDQVKLLRMCMASKVRAEGKDGVEIVDLGSSLWSPAVTVFPKLWIGWSKNVPRGQPFHLDLRGCRVTGISDGDLSSYRELRSFIASANLAVLSSWAFAMMDHLVFVDLRPARALMELPFACFLGTVRLRKLLMPPGIQRMQPVLVERSGLRELDLSGLKCQKPYLGLAGCLRTLICAKVSLSRENLVDLAGLSDLTFCGKVEEQRSSVRRLRVSGLVQPDEGFLCAERAFVLTELASYGVVKGRPAFPG